MKFQDGSIRCDRGATECNANKLQSCVLEYAKMKHALAFIICFERSLTDSNLESAFQYCSSFIRNHYRRIRSTLHFLSKMEGALNIG